MDCAAVRGMTKFGFRCYSRNNKAVMLRVVAASMVECQGYMDSATARGMTKFGFRCYSRNNKAVMLRIVAASMVE